MITKGAGVIRGVHSLNTRPGPITERSGLLKLQQLATEKENLLKKLEWLQAQKDQTEKRLSEIAHTMHSFEKTIEERAKRESASTSHSGVRSTIIKY